MTHKGSVKRSGVVRCQKCLKYGHYTYECENEHAYRYRPSRTVMFKQNIKTRLDSERPPETRSAWDGDQKRAVVPDRPSSDEEAAAEAMEEEQAGEVVKEERVLEGEKQTPPLPIEEEKKGQREGGETTVKPPTKATLEDKPFGAQKEVEEGQQSDSDSSSSSSGSSSSSSSSSEEPQQGRKRKQTSRKRSDSDSDSSSIPKERERSRDLRKEKP